MKVAHFQVQAGPLETTFSADFIFAKPFDGRLDMRFFQAKSLLKKLTKPRQLLKDGLSVAHTIWFKLPTQLATNAAYYDAFFTLALPLALVLNENLDFAGPVSAEIIAKTAAMKPYFELPKSRIKIKTQTSVESAAPLSQKSHGLAQFFTLGVDSFYTLFCHQPARSRALIFVDGYDIPLGKHKFLDTIHRKIIEVTHQPTLKQRNQPVFVATNLRKVADKVLSWGRYHVAALAAVGMLLPFKAVLISGETYEADDWGLRYGVDKLFSTANLTFSLIGHNVTRDLKITQLQQSPHLPIFLSYARTCWKNIEQDSDDVPYNCSECQKCLRTQLTMLALGIETQPTFKYPIDLKKLAKIVLFPHVLNEWQITYQLLQQKTDIDPQILAAVKAVLAKPLKT